MPMELPKKRPAKTKSGEMPPSYSPSAAIEAPATMRIRFLKFIASRKYGRFTLGQAAFLPAAQAQELISMGLAEEDKMIDQAPEVK